MGNVKDENWREMDEDEVLYGEAFDANVWPCRNTVPIDVFPPILGNTQRVVDVLVQNSLMWGGRHLNRQIWLDPYCRSS